MCDAIATSLEHAPSLCLFPEIEEDELRRDFRRNLITVPSCDTHNSAKSRDDEYIRLVLVSGIGANELGHQLARTKIARSIARRPSLMLSLLQKSTPAFVLDNESQQWIETLRIELDPLRVYTVLMNMARALYFRHFETKWLDSVTVIPHFGSYGWNTDAITRETRQAHERVLSLADSGLVGAPRLGDNPELLHYKVLRGDTQPQGAIMRCTFYDNIALTFLFPAQSAPAEPP
jgi:hypothetical protein